MIEYFGFSPFLASFVALTELGAGLFLIVGGLIKGSIGNLITRVSALTIAVVMINAFALAHRDWFITTKLFTSEQIFLLIGGMAFWMLLFLMGFILPYWITLSVFEQLRPKRVLEDEEK